MQLDKWMGKYRGSVKPCPDIQSHLIMIGGSANPRSSLRRCSGQAGRCKTEVADFDVSILVWQWGWVVFQIGERKRQWFDVPINIFPHLTRMDAETSKDVTGKCRVTFKTYYRGAAWWFGSNQYPNLQRNESRGHTIWRLDMWIRASKIWWNNLQASSSLRPSAMRYGHQITYGERLERTPSLTSINVCRSTNSFWKKGINMHITVRSYNYDTIWM